jgi:tetratricopeptide (TPR) repeat protein
MMEAVHRYEGTVNQVMGDGIMALFGAPLAHEDHAARACYAALRMQDAVRRFGAEVRRSQNVPVRIRVGLNSGDVVVRAIGSDLHMDYTAVGQTTHLAARMEQFAEPGTTLLTAATAALAEGFVEVTSQGRREVKGLSDGVEVYQLIGANGARSRFQVRAARGLTPFVGRGGEVVQLLDALDLARGGRGQLVAVVGEPGVGKSRLFGEFARSPRTAGCLMLEAAAMPYATATAYFPVSDLLRRYFQIEPRDDVGALREKVTGALQALDPALQTTRPALLELLGAPAGDEEWKACDPPQRRQRTIDAVKRVLLRESRRGPLVLVFEDLHWIDPESQALLESLLDSVPTARCLVLASYRPEYRHGWGSKTFYRQVRLDALPDASAGELLHSLLGFDPSLETLTRILIERTEGNPFFLEETVRGLVETRMLAGSPGRYRVQGTVEALQIPATAQAILAARIDRLDPDDKWLLQAAAVIGKDFAVPLLTAIADVPDAQLRAGLTRLQAAEFVYEAALFPDAEYTFKHALTHEVAYGGLLQDHRQQLHARVVEAIEALHGERRAEHIERLAYHAFRGGIWSKALEYGWRAGDRAMAQSAYAVAVGCFEQALDALAKVPPTRTAQEQAIDLRLELRSALTPTASLPTRTLACLREAEALALALGDRRRLGRVLRFLTINLYRMGVHEEALATGRRALAIATDVGDEVLEALASQSLGEVYWAHGDYAPAVECFERANALVDGERRDQRLGSLIFPVVFNRSGLAMAHADLGTFSEGRAVAAEALRIAQHLGHPPSIIWAGLAVGLVAVREGDIEEAVVALERALELCRESNVGFTVRVAAPLGTAYALAGRIHDGIQLITRELASQSTLISELMCRLALSELQIEARLWVEAQQEAERALALAREHAFRPCHAQALWLLGTIAVRRDAAAGAESLYREALALASALGMRPLVAHCHLGLGKLYQRTDKREPAKEHLATASTMYHDMGMTYWLEQAEAAMRELG